IRRPVRLLQDDRGIYGIEGELTDSFRRGEGAPVALVLRPDRLANVEVDHQLGLLSRKHYNPILQAITIRLWRGALEEGWRREIHRELLRGAGLVDESLGEEWWSSDRKQQDRNRRKYHGLKLSSLGIINTLIRQALAEAADQNALKMARRFPFP